MANQPAAIHPHMRRDLLQQPANAAARRVRLLINSAAILMSTAGSVIVHAGAGPEASAVGGGMAWPVVASLLFLLGVSLAMLALVADEFP